MSQSSTGLLTSCPNCLSNSHSFMAEKCPKDLCSWHNSASVR